jgi:hypothetical protein
MSDLSGEDQMKKINVIIDTMILQDIYDNIGIECFNDIFANKDIDLELLISWVNIFEKIRGIKEDYNYQKNKDIIKMALSVPYVCFLANPEAHIKMKFDMAQWEIDAKFTMSMLFDFRDIGDMPTFMNKWGDWFSKSNADLERIKREYDEMAQTVADILRSNKDASNGPFYESLKPYLVNKFRIPEEYVASDYEKFYDDFPSIKYFAEVFMEFAVGIGKSIYRKDVGNYLDNSQVLYLNIADYFITNDKNLITRMRNLKSKVLINRVFTLDEFFKLENSQISHCAPEEFSDYCEFSIPKR